MKLLPLVLLLFQFHTAYTQNFALKDSGSFTPQQKKVLLFQSTAGKPLILFKTDLMVNTDGIPTSYHPFDLRGDSIALNTILNGAAIYRLKDNIRISNPKKPNNFTKTERIAMQKEAYTAFEKYRDANFDSMPAGYNIIWKNVLIADPDGKPCVLKEGKYKGYFASATALKNDLTTNKGECDCNNQVNPFEVPTLVLAGGNNIVKKFGAQVGDLLVAYNLSNGNFVYAVIGDSGPPDNLGEGSVALNMQLVGTDKFPATRKQTYALSTGKNILVCIVPKSKAYKIQKPYTKENVQERIMSWFSEQGLTAQNQIVDFLKLQQGRFK